MLKRHTRTNHKETTFDCMNCEIMFGVRYIIDLVMVHQFYSNGTSDHQPKKYDYLNFWFLIGYLQNPFCKLNFGNLKIL